MDTAANGHNTGAPRPGQADAATPTLAGPRVMLRPISPGDYQRLRALELAPQLLWRWRHSGGTPAPEQWVSSLWNGVTAQYLVIDHRTGDWIGLTAAYQADMRNGHAHIAAAKFSAEDHSRRMLDGTILFIDYVLATWPLRKLYMEVPAYNLDQIRSEIGKLLTQEGQLSEHVWLNGRHWDMYVLALTRNAWEQERPHLLGQSASTKLLPERVDRTTLLDHIRTEFALDPKIGEDARLIEHHGFDSIELVRLALHLEHTHGVQLPEQLDYLTLTLNDIWHYYDTQTRAQ